MSTIWEATIAAEKQELAEKRSRIEKSLAALHHQQSDYAGDHRRLLRLYERMAQAMDEA